MELPVTDPVSWGVDPPVVGLITGKHTHTQHDSAGGLYCNRGCGCCFYLQLLSLKYVVVSLPSTQTLHSRNSLFSLCVFVCLWRLAGISSVP